MQLQRFFLFLFICSLIWACNSAAPALEQIEQKDAYGYTEKFLRKQTDFAKQGLYERFDENGTKVEEANYENDTLNGFRILYGEKGDTQVVEQYKMGLFDGVFKAYHE